MEIKFSAPPLGPARDCRVFMPNDPRTFDVSDLRRFGIQVIPLAPYRSIFPDEAGMMEDRLISEMSLNLRRMKFNSKTDYMALVGDPLIIACAMLTLGKVLDSVVLLRYDSQSRSYWPFRAKR